MEALITKLYCLNFFYHKPNLEREKRVSRLSGCFNGILNIKVNRISYYVQYKFLFGREMCNIK